MEIEEDQWESMDEDGDVGSEELDEEDVPFKDGRDGDGLGSESELGGGKVSSPNTLRFRVIASARISRVVTVNGKTVKTGPPNALKNLATSPSPLRDVPLPRSLARLVRITPQGKLDARDWARVARQAFASGGMRGWSRKKNSFMNSTPQQPGKFQWEIKRTRLLPPLHDTNDPKLQQNQTKKALIIVKALWATLYRRRFSATMPLKLRTMLNRHDFWYGPDELKYLAQLSRLFDACLGAEESESESDSDYEGEGDDSQSEKGSEEDEGNSGESGSYEEYEDGGVQTWSRSPSRDRDSRGSGRSRSPSWDRSRSQSRNRKEAEAADVQHAIASSLERRLSRSPSRSQSRSRQDDFSDDDGRYVGGDGYDHRDESEQEDEDDDNRPIFIPASSPQPPPPPPYHPSSSVMMPVIQPANIPAWTEDARWRNQLVMRINAYNDSSRKLLIQSPVFRFGANSSPTFPLSKRDYERACAEGSLVHKPYDQMKAEWDHGVYNKPGRGAAMTLLQFADKLTRRTVGWIVVDLFSMNMLRPFPTLQKIRTLPESELRALVKRIPHYSPEQVDAMGVDTVMKELLRHLLRVFHGVPISASHPSFADFERARRALYATFHELVPFTRRHEFMEFHSVPRGEKQTSFSVATAKEVSAVNRALKNPVGIAQIIMQCTKAADSLPILQSLCKLMRSLGAHYVVMDSSAALLASQANFKEATVHTFEIKRALDNNTRLVETESARVTSVLMADTLKCEG